MPCPDYIYDFNHKGKSCTWAESDLSLVTVHAAGTCLGFPRVLLLPRCPLLFPGHAYRYCSAYGTWAMALSINKTWANYTECALLFSSESRSREKVTVFVLGKGYGWGPGKDEAKAREVLGEGRSSLSAPQTSPAPPVLWQGGGAQSFSSRRCLTACT